MQLKPGVRIYGIRPEMVWALSACSEVYRKEGYELVVTSISEGKHQRASKHYTGCAADLRMHMLPNPGLIVQFLRQALGEDFDVVLEKDHIHIEFDPKASY